MTTRRRPLPPMFGHHPLPAGLNAQLEAYCAREGERPADILADALAAFLDAAEGEIFTAQEAMVMIEGPSARQWLRPVDCEPIEREG